ncbi:CPBP family intramembrane glutamic endopeptidase [Acidicapsa dinghuensis]|uniref:CPBP family intramembrane glutamic endopeptidase n=1 Tax=Acidicapsa dinghuensis TaxID=2218256 RepID=A0ABW1EMB8_9BACT|nr:CPBP family intramembrane glutamic endopeptidase [Acidicapsa dinghuensis]
MTTESAGGSGSVPPPFAAPQSAPSTPPPFQAAPPAMAPLVFPAPSVQQSRNAKAIRQFGHFIFAVLFFFLARLLARHGARGLVSEDWVPLVEQAMFAFLLIFGFAGLGFSLDQQLHPISQQGLGFRKGWLGELGLGVAVGWAIAIICVLPLVFFGGIVIHTSFSRLGFEWLLADAAYFLLGTLTVQVAFRGYPFQAAIRSIGELPATLMLSVLYGILYASLPGAGRASMAVCIAIGLLLSMSYLRTRALWLAWGTQFGWDASRALLFGLPVRGISTHSPVLQGIPTASVSLSGGSFGLDGSWFAFVVLLVALPVVYRLTRDLSFEHNAPVLEPGGFPVDIDSAARRQHEAVMGPTEPPIQPLVQILPAAAPPPAQTPISPQAPDSLPDSIQKP